MNNDLISREALKEAINSTIEQATKIGIMADADYLWELLNYAIDNAPTVEQNWRFYYDHGYAQAKRDFARPQGEWIKQENNNTKFFCSKCGRIIDTKPFTRPDNFPFCHCGAKMQGTNNIMGNIQKSHRDCENCAHCIPAGAVSFCELPYCDFKPIGGEP
jgi:hypothetical protein